MAASILRYELNGKARICAENLRFVLGPYALCHPCEASEPKWGQNLKKTSNSKKEYQNRIRNDRVMPIIGCALKWQLAYFGAKVGYFGHIF